jgi:hypothetical protein
VTSSPIPSGPTVEYQIAVTAAELTWVNSVVDDLSQGALRWTKEDFSSAADAYHLDDSQSA